jgi:DDE family transposase
MTHLGSSDPLSSRLWEQHPDRNAQLEHINEKVEEFEKKGNPELSVDCKKQELLGNFKNHGREWQAKGEDPCVNVYDFVSLADGKAVPYGIYDLVNKSGFGSARH